MKASELRQQGQSTLRTMLRELSTKHFQLRMQNGSGQLTANHQLKAMRKDIARVNTLLTELENKGE